MATPAERERGTGQACTSQRITSDLIAQRTLIHSSAESQSQSVVRPLPVFFGSRSDQKVSPDGLQRKPGLLARASATAPDIATSRCDRIILSSSRASCGVCECHHGSIIDYTMDLSSQASAHPAYAGTFQTAAHPRRMNHLPPVLNPPPVDLPGHPSQPTNDSSLRTATALQLCPSSAPMLFPRSGECA